MAFARIRNSRFQNCKLISIYCRNCISCLCLRRFIDHHYFFWAKGGVFVLLVVKRNFFSFFTVCSFSNSSRSGRVVNSSYSELTNFKGRVLYFQNMPIQKRRITKNSFTIRTNYLFPIRQPFGALRNYENSIYEFQIAPISPPED